MGKAPAFEETVEFPPDLSDTGKLQKPALTKRD